MDCVICSNSPSSGENLCDQCLGLLRWFREYFAHDLGEGALDTLTLQTRFLEELGVDSLDYVNWQVEAEEKLSIHLTDQELVKVQTIKDLLLLLQNKGAVWPDQQKICLVQRGNCFKRYVWQIAEKS